MKTSMKRNIFTICFESVLEKVYIVIDPPKSFIVYQESNAVMFMLQPRDNIPNGSQITVIATGRLFKLNNT